MPTYDSRGPDQNGLPPSVQDLLVNCPASGSGQRQVHAWLLKCANHLRHHVPAEKAADLIRQHISRRPEPNEISEAIQKAYSASSAQLPKAQRLPDFEPDPDAIATIVAERTPGGRSPLKELQASSSPIPVSTAEILQILFPDPATFLCVGRTIRSARTWPRRQITNPEGFQFIVPNPMKTAALVDPAGRAHPRCNNNVLCRRYLICDLDIKPGPRYDPLIATWNQAGVTLLDAQAAVIEYLGQVGPLVLVTFSGNQSLQGWFFCEGENESRQSKMRAFFESAIILGTDPAGWVRCQFFRMPGAQRFDTGHRQTVFYLNPRNVLR